MPRPRKKFKNKNIKLKFAAKTDSIQTLSASQWWESFVKNFFFLAPAIFYSKQFIKPAILLLSLKNINILFYELVKDVFPHSLKVVQISIMSIM